MKLLLSKSFLLYIQACLLLVLLVGCAIIRNPITWPTESLSSIEPNHAQTSPTIEATFHPASTIVVVRTPTPVYTLTTTFPAIVTDARSSQIVFNLLQQNGGCKIPCWWGLEPGKTSWKTALDYFLQLGQKPRSWTNISLPQYRIWGAGFDVPEYDFGVYAMFFVDKNGIIRLIAPSAQTSPAPDEIIYGDDFYLKAMRQYRLPAMLKNYGQPEQALLYLQQASDPVAPDYQFILFYANAGVLVEYYGQSQEQGDQLRLCPIKTYQEMWLWDPNENLSLEDVFVHQAMLQTDDLKKHLALFLPLKDATGLNISEFTINFQSDNACLETPKSLWGRK